MKRGLVAILAYAAVAANAGVASFEGLHWGMSRQEVQSRYPNFEEWDERVLEFELEGWVPTTPQEVVRRRYGLQSHYAAGCDFMFKLDFTDNELTQAVLDQNTGDRDCRARVREGLREKYGLRPEVSPNPFGDELLTWSDGAIAIVFRADRLPGDKWNVRVIYTDSDALRRNIKRARTTKGL